MAQDFIIIFDDYYSDCGLAPMKSTRIKMVVKCVIERHMNSANNFDRFFYSFNTTSSITSTTLTYLALS